MSESVKQNYRDISSRLSETEGMRVIVDNLYSNYVTTQQAPDAPITKYVHSQQNERNKRPWWHWLVIAVIGVALFAAGGGLMVFINHGFNGPQNFNTTHQIPIAPVTPAKVNNDYADDRRVLMELFNATDGPNWILNKGWMTARSMCDWAGIECSTVGDMARVVLINLSTFGLNGTIPESIGNLTNLHVLDLSYNYLRGTIPKSLTNLMSLENLVLSHNNLHGEIWPEFIQLSQTLQWFEIADNAGISGGFPEWIPRMASLNNVYLQNCNLSGTLPANSLSGRLLREIDLSDNNFIGALPPTITIMSFKASRNNFEGNLPPSCTQELYLAGNKLTGNLGPIKNCGHASKVDLSNNMLSGTIGGNFLSKIMVLNLANNNFSSVSLQSSTVALTSCDLDNNALACPLPDWAENICNAVCT